MRIRWVSLSILVMLWGPGLSHAAARPNYYLALGDSLAIGVQPSASGEDVSTNQGYADDLYALFPHAYAQAGLGQARMLWRDHDNHDRGQHLQLR